MGSDFRSVLLCFEISIQFSGASHTIELHSGMESGGINGSSESGLIFATTDVLSRVDLTGGKEWLVITCITPLGRSGAARCIYPQHDSALALLRFATRFGTICSVHLHVTGIGIRFSLQVQYLRQVLKKFHGQISTKRYVSNTHELSRAS